MDWGEIGGVATVLLVIGASGRWLYGRFRNWEYRIANFRLAFVDRPPPAHTVHNHWFPYEIPIGAFRVCCLIQARLGFALSRVNFRFLNLDGTNVPSGTIEVLQIAEADGGTNRLEERLSDTVGGIDGVYKMPAHALGLGEGRYFWVAGRAAFPWEGNLSFRGQTIEGARSNARHRVIVKDLPKSPLHEPGSSATYISMRDAAVRFYSEARQAKDPRCVIVESKAKTTDDVLDKVATLIAGAIPVYGKRPPSTNTEKVLERDMGVYRFADGASTLKNLYGSPEYFTGLSVVRSELEDLIREMWMEAGFREQWNR